MVATAMRPYVMGTLRDVATVRNHARVSSLAQSYLPLSSVTSRKVRNVQAHSVNEVINSLSIAHITCIVVLGTLLRLALIRLRAGIAQSTAEVVESGILVIVGMFLIVRPFVLQAFFIPSPSMEPTLIGKNGVGDRILVNKLIYRLSSPSRDDVAVFIPPPNAIDGDNLEESPGVPVNFIKRVIAAPGDRLQVTAGKIWIDGEAYGHTAVRLRLFGDGSDGNDLQADHHVRFTDRGVTVDGKLMDQTRLASLMVGDPKATVHVVPGQTILNGKPLDEPFIAEDPDYDLEIFHGKSLKFDSAQGARLNGQAITLEDYTVDHAAGPGTLPSRMYFMMGDNRNDSKDSTEWGPLDESRIVGRAQLVFWPLNRVRTIR